MVPPRPAIGVPTVPDTEFDENAIPIRTSDAIVPLGPLESLMLSKIDGRRSIARLAALFGLTPLEVVRTVRRLSELHPIELIPPGSSGAEALFRKLDQGWDEIDDAVHQETRVQLLDRDQIEQLRRGLPVASAPIRRRKAR